MLININDANAIRNALEDLIGYESDNSCSDPDCCGGPYYELEHFNDAVEVLLRYGIKYDSKDSAE